MQLDLPHEFDFRGHAIRWGRMGDGPPLVAVHGTPFSSQVWRRIVPHLARRWRVHYFDLLGYGQSDMPDGDVSLGVQNGLLSALFNEWGLKVPEVLAHDFGGATVLRAHYLDGLHYSRLTLVDPVAIAPWGSPFVAHVRNHEPAFAGLPDYAHEAMLDAYLQGASFCGLSDETIDIYAAPWHGTAGKAGFYRQIAQMDQRYTDEVEPHYGPTDFPVTLLWGEQDEWIPLKRGRSLSERLSVDRFLTVPEAGHLIQDDAPEAIISALMNL
jgi:pimeloyl-ACP methyl ester carboxylesterase